MRKIRYKVLLILSSVTVMFTGLRGFSHACCLERDSYDTAVTQGEGYNRMVDELLRRDNDDELRTFWFDCIDNDNVELLDIFFNRLDYPDQNYFFYLNDDMNRTSLERAIAYGRVSVAEYLAGILYR